MWTDGTVSPIEAVKKGAETLLEQFFLFANADKAGEGTAERPSFIATIPMEHYNTPIEKLELSSRTLNCLKRSNINKVGQVLEIEEADLLKIRNFGEKSLDELYSKLSQFGFLPEGAVRERASNGGRIGRGGTRTRPSRKLRQGLRPKPRPLMRKSRYETRSSGTQTQPPDQPSLVDVSHTGDGP